MTGVEAAETAIVMGEYAVTGIEPLIEMTASEAATLEAQMKPLAFSTLLLKNLKIAKLGPVDAPAGIAGGGLLEESPCPEGGWRKVYCDADETTGTIRMVADHCTQDNAGTLTQENGTLTMVVPDPLVCETGMMGYPSMTVRADNYTVTQRVAGELVGSTRMNGTISMVEGPDVGCPYIGGSATASIRLDVLSLEDEIDATLTTSNLQVTDELTPGTCAQLITLNGTMGLDDRVDGDAVRQTFTDFRIWIFEDVGHTLMTLDGQTHAKCVGDVVFETLESLMILTDADCPMAGLVQVTMLDTGETAIIQFMGDGSVEMDLGGDGTVDLVRESCLDLTAHGSCY